MIEENILIHIEIYVLIGIGFILGVFSTLGIMWDRKKEKYRKINLTMKLEGELLRCIGEKADLLEKCIHMGWRVDDEEILRTFYEIKEDLDAKTERFCILREMFDELR